VPKSQSHAYIGESTTSEDVLAAIDFDIKFTYVLAGWAGSIHDVGYACRLDILLPFRSTRYNLNEFSTRHCPRDAHELFNLGHSSLTVPD
jgi:hypothetical protein